LVLHAFGRVGLTRYNYSKLIELTQVSLSSSYLRRVDVIQALHAEDSTNGWVGCIDLHASVQSRI